MPIWDVCDCYDCQLAKRGWLTPAEQLEAIENERKNSNKPTESETKWPK